MKKCPFCAEEIQAEAKKCKHCGEFLEETKTEKKSGNRTGIGDFSRCKILKKGPANVRCPKCGFHGITKEIKGDYNPTIFWILFIFFPMIGGILYYLFTTKTKYVCPDCDTDYLEVLDQSKQIKKTSPVTRAVGILGIIMMIGLIGKSRISTQTPQRTDTRQEKLAEATTNRLQTIIDLNRAEVPEFVGAELSGDMIIINYSKQPKFQTADMIARGQAVNLSRERGQATGSPEFAIVRVKVANKVVAACRANNAKIVSCN